MDAVELEGPMGAAVAIAPVDRVGIEPRFMFRDAERYAPSPTMTEDRSDGLLGLRLLLWCCTTPAGGVTRMGRTRLCTRG